jgi:hypothetical protein
MVESFQAFFTAEQSAQPELRRTHYSMTRMASISTCEPFGRAATPMAARAG